ncbi:MAG: hypothetical protein PGN08_05430 [Sphingomonas taxi]
MRHRHPVMRWAQIALGLLLIVGAGVVAPLPGPGGVFLFVPGFVLLLRNSRWVQRQWVRRKRRWRRVGHFVDRAMRRPSALRRHARDGGGPR